jgi:hypothetical protein
MPQHPAPIKGRKITDCCVTADYQLIAICDDGTAWQYPMGANVTSIARKWSELPIILTDQQLNQQADEKAAGKPATLPDTTNMPPPPPAPPPPPSPAPVADAHQGPGAAGSAAAAPTTPPPGTHGTGSTQPAHA